MGPSLVISTVTSMATGWNQNTLTSSEKSSNSFTEDDEEEEEEGNRMFSNEARTRHFNESFQTEHTSFQLPLEPAPDEKRKATTLATNTRNSSASSSVHIDVNEINASTEHGDELPYHEYIMSPLFLPALSNPYNPPLGGDVEYKESISDDAKLDEGHGDDRKPHAVQLSKHDEEHQRAGRTDTTDPYGSTVASPIMQQHQRLPSNDQFIDPTFSFGDDDAVGVPARNFEVGQEMIPSLWGASSSDDPISNLHARRHHFTPPQAEFHTPSRPRITSYAAASTQPSLEFRLGDINSNTARAPDSMPNPNLLSLGDMHPASSSSLTLQPQVRNLVLQRRTASAMEIESAETDRARSAIHVWYQRFNELIDYCEVYGDCNVPQKYPPNQQLGIWVNKQRMEKKFMDERKRTSMTPAKVEALDSIGFTWAKRKGDASWMLKYNELKLYNHQFGSCDVPTKYTPNPALGRWVSTQRSEYKVYMSTGGRSRHLTAQKIDLLNQIGFKWEMIPSRLSNSSGHSNSSGTTAESGGGGNRPPAAAAAAAAAATATSSAAISRRSQHHRRFGGDGNVPHREV